MILNAIKRAAVASVCTGTLGAGAASAQEAPPPPTAAVQNTAENPGEIIGEVIVTARLRNEKLSDTPVSVTALSQQDILKYNAADLTKLGELTPTVIISNYRQTGGGSIAIRGISSPATQQGFEQPVSVSMDGVQSSSGRIATLGYFDLQQVEILKGPQTLFFGKNSPAGVIAVTSAGPSSYLEVGGRATYEFVADEKIAEAHLSGPITDTFGARLAVKYREMTGWIHNDAQPAPNPFFPASLPASLGTLPGRQSPRVGDDEIMARLTLQFDPNDRFSLTAKLFGTSGHDQGAAAYAQNIGPCPTGRAIVFGVPDSFAECRADNHASLGDPVPIVAGSLPRAGNDTDRSWGRLSAYIASLNAELTFDNFTMTSITGATEHEYKNLSSLTHTNESALLALEDGSFESFSQELRMLTTFDGPVNLLLGLFYQDTTDVGYYNVVIRSDLSYRSDTGRFDTFEHPASLQGVTHSAFSQVIWNIMPKLELAGGLRWTSEEKRVRHQNLYGIDGPIGRFNTANTVFVGSSDPTPGILAGTFKDDNLSPEVTLSWHPVADSTIYAAYKTGFKSGGFGLTSPIQTNTTLDDIDFISESVTGVELGAKGQLLDRRLRLAATAFAYDFKDLQVTTFDAEAFRYKINNAGKVQQRGFEIEGEWKANDILRVHGALAYVRNRIEDYIGPCYGYTIPASVALTAAAPSQCSFVLNPDGTRFRTATGAPVLQQVNDGRAPPRSPDWSGNGGFDATFPVGSGLELTFTGDAFYSSSYYSSDSYSPTSIQPDFWRFNASARIGDSAGKWEFALLGRNLTNEYYLLFAGDRTGGASVPLTPGEQRATIARGREVALQGVYNFR